MNLIEKKGKRERYSWKEVMACMEMTHKQIRLFVAKGLLRKAFSGSFPFHRDHVNEFIRAFNHGKI